VRNFLHSAEKAKAQVVRRYMGEELGQRWFIFRASAAHLETKAGMGGECVFIVIWPLN